jgi:uncharacterized protein (DUF924 family)
VLQGAAGRHHPDWRHGARALTPSDILDFWLRDTPAERWFAVDPALDAEIRARFETAWRAAKAGAFSEWEQTPEGALALILLLDQFPRNMFRGRADAFATDARARDVAQRAVTRDFDLAVPEGVRQFFYMPFMHAENLGDQETCIRLIESRLGAAHYSHPFALRHRDVIARFGRFPARNRALGRESSLEEANFLAANPAGF